MAKKESNAKPEQSVADLAAEKAKRHEAKAKQASSKEHAEKVDRMRRIRAVRRLARPFPHATLDERLEQIVGVASGKVDAGTVRRKRQTVEEIAKRLHDSVGTPSKVATARAKEAADAASREEAAGKDRKERGGATRAE